ncbi:ExeA family protein [Caldimonas brevitalea]|uniref:Peptidoglycan-binding protein n=1 Tax=Caldimonas brevitalea TaxID=413882 RepID=A0A0G3BTM4_9BURK|nr:ExeA family protein [Caldimonas brevitalea]AKJ31358.1 peptidoglycan-binding protein [Caldimonas brevitalea]
MYAKFFGLRHEPFSIAPDPRYLFMSDRHREALAHLLYGLRSGGGFVLLTGEIGAGKTTVCRCFLKKIPRRCNVAYIFNPKLTVHELLKSVCDEFRICYEHQGPGPATVKDYLDPLNDFLLKAHAAGQDNVLIIDEAQNLSADVLEQLRLLTNLETSERKLLQIILIGQPELRGMLARPELEQLAQRVIARFHLEALSEAETAQYIRHRLAVAGISGPVPFDRKAMQAIHRLSRGVPRRINLLCDRALLGAYASGKAKVDARIVDKAAREVFNSKTERSAVPLRRRPRRMAAVGLSLAAGAAVVGVAALALEGRFDRHAVAAAPAAAASAALAASAPASSASPPKPSLVSVAAPGSGPATGSAAVPESDLSASSANLLRSEKDAWRELAQAWGVTLPEGDPCEQAAGRQLHCFRTGGGLALIRQLARPGILTLHDHNDKPAYALLTGLGDRSATLRVAGVTQKVSLTSLARMWRGDFSTFWRTPTGYQDSVGEGDAGPVVDHLVRSLASANGRPPPTGPHSFDAALKSEVYTFQLAQGLKPDGRAGPTTFMQLNRATGVAEPRLQTER